jgi:hypothetical protein
MTEQWEAGVELDREIARRIFDIKTERLTSLGHRGGNIVVGETHITVPPYSTDVAAAMTIARHFGRDTVPLADPSRRVTFWAEMHRAADEQYRICWPDALGVIDVPLAICRAALAAVEGR